MNAANSSGSRPIAESTMQASKRVLESELTLRLLSEIDGDEPHSQRSLAFRLSIAVGLANAYLKRCVRKGLVKVRQVPARRYAYYLTPKGFAEKSQLTAEYLSSSLEFFRDARAQCVELLQHCEWNEWRRVALAGEGDLAEIATLAARETSVELVAVIAPGCNLATVAGLPVVPSVEAVDNLDAVIVTDIRASQATYDDLRERLSEERVLTPHLLHVSRRRRADGGDGR